jgi:hypothetical protein
VRNNSCMEISWAGLVLIAVFAFFGLMALQSDSVLAASGAAMPSKKTLETLPTGARNKVRPILEKVRASAALTQDANTPAYAVTQRARLLAGGSDSGDKFGFSVAASVDTVVVGVPYRSSSAELSHGAVYIFERNAGGADQWGQVKKLLSSDRAEGDYFGGSVAVFVDTVVVGAFGKDSPAGVGAGAAYVFERNGGGANQWGQVKKLLPSDPAAGDEFGRSVSLFRDTVVIGVENKDSPAGVDTGATYVFERNAGGADQWGQVKKLLPSDPAAEDYFGSSVALYGDTVVVGAFGKNSPAGVRVGTAYVFERHTGGANQWGQVKKLLPSDPAAEDYFGSSVALYGDAVVVGAFRKDSPAGVRVGTAYVFERHTGGANQWGQVKKLLPSDLAAEDQFGHPVALFGDTLVIGSSYKGSPVGAYAGAAYVFERNAGGANQWGQVKKLLPSDPAAGDVFGSSVALSGDTVAVGAALAEGYAGAAYVFTRDGGGTQNWGEVRRLLISEPRPGDRFGSAVSIHRDLALVGAPNRDLYNANDAGTANLYYRLSDGTNRWDWIKTFVSGDPGDGFGCSTALGEEFAFVGALADDTAKGIDSGSVRVFRRDQNGANQWGFFKTLTASDGGAFDFFGNALALDGDTLLVGAQIKNLSGSAYIFQRNQGSTDNWGEVRKLLPIGGAFLDLFGKAVALQGDRIVVGSYGDDDAGESSGSAYIFERDQGGINQWGQVKKLTAQDAGQGDWFGWSVAVSGEWVAVGAVQDDDGGENAGAVYLFHRNQGGNGLWGQVKKLTAPDATAGDFFGTSVSLDGDLLLVGADGKNSSGEDSGRSYLFGRNQGDLDHWGEITRFGPGDPAALDKFGFALALDGTRLIIAAIGKNLGGPEAGAAYIFDLLRVLYLPVVLK